MANGDDTTPGDGARLSAEAAAFLRRISRWHNDGWRLSAGQGSRSDVVFGLVQELADVVAAAERRPSRPVPRLEDAMLPDQITVMVRDVLVGGSGEAARAALSALRRGRSLLFG